MGRRAHNYLPPSTPVFMVKVENMTGLGGRTAIERGINPCLEYMIKNYFYSDLFKDLQKGTFNLGNRVTENEQTKMKLEIEATQKPYQFNFRVTEPKRNYELLSGYIINKTEEEKIICEACARLTSTGNF